MELNSNIVKFDLAGVFDTTVFDYPNTAIVLYGSVNYIRDKQAYY
jgi:hypothetical protein